MYHARVPFFGGGPLGLGATVGVAVGVGVTAPGVDAVTVGCCGGGATFVDGPVHAATSRHAVTSRAVCTSRAVWLCGRQRIPSCCRHAGDRSRPMRPSARDTPRCPGD